MNSKMICNILLITRISEGQTTFGTIFHQEKVVRIPPQKKSIPNCEVA